MVYSNCGAPPPVLGPPPWRVTNLGPPPKVLGPPPWTSRKHVVMLLGTPVHLERSEAFLERLPLHYRGWVLYGGLGSRRGAR